MDRKPPTKMDAPPAESKVVKSLRAEPSIWARVEQAALVRSSDFSATGRDALLMGLSLLENPPLMEAYVRAVCVLQGQQQRASA